jgi:hypothetical protein
MQTTKKLFPSLIYRKWMIEVREKRLETKFRVESGTRDLELPTSLPDVDTFILFLIMTAL